MEPDRYVMLSNHRDAWGYGALDPGSGTAQLMEVAKTFGTMLKQGWRPRRTIILASWAAEEYLDLGSYEWVFHHTAKLMNRVVGLVNTDICVTGPIAKPQTSPILQDTFSKALKMADDPTEDGERKYYEFWDEWTNRDNQGEHKEPKFGRLGSGSDHAPFAFYANIPAVSIRFRDDDKRYPGIGTYPAYHTGYETFYLMDQLVDPGFKIMKTCTQTSLHILLELADSAILPYNLERLPEVMKQSMDIFDSNNVTSVLEQGGVSLKFVKEAVQEFSEATKNFMSNLKSDKTPRSGGEEKSPMELRIINDQLMQVERVFNLPSGLPSKL